MTNTRDGELGLSRVLCGSVVLSLFAVDSGSFKMMHAPEQRLDA